MCRLLLKLPSLQSEELKSSSCTCLAQLRLRFLEEGWMRGGRVEQTEEVGKEAEQTVRLPSSVLSQREASSAPLCSSSPHA